MHNVQYVQQKQYKKLFQITNITQIFVPKLKNHNADLQKVL